MIENYAISSLQTGHMYVSLEEVFLFSLTAFVLHALHTTCEQLNFITVLAVSLLRHIGHTSLLLTSYLALC